MLKEFVACRLDHKNIVMVHIKIFDHGCDSSQFRVLYARIGMKSHVEVNDVVCVVKAESLVSSRIGTFIGNNESVLMVG